MPKPIKLTPVEWEIMEAVWQLGGGPAVRDVLEHAYPHGGERVSLAEFTEKIKLMTLNIRIL
ncbi:MAG: hypothetical protein ABIA59_06710 [Candidatus Latescibacterota bacterium]